MLCFGPEEPGRDFLVAQIDRALARREGQPLLAGTDALRPVNAEGDGLPGLVVDRFADVLAVQITSVGMDVRTGSQSPPTLGPSRRSQTSR